MRKKLVIFLLVLVIIPLNIFSQTGSGSLTLHNDFKIGDKYKIMQYRANVRAQPGRDSNVIAILSVHDEVEILENTWNQEEINHIWGCWYKIRFGNITGYTFGGNIARGAASINTGENKISAYFRITFSYGGNPWPVDGWLYPYINPHTGIFIYENNRRIDSTMIFQYDLDYNEDKLYRNMYTAQWCDVEEKNDHILLKLHIYGRRASRYSTIYKIDENANISFFEYDEEGNKYRLDEDGNTWAKFNEWWDDEWWHSYNRIIDRKEIDGDLWIRYEKIDKSHASSF